MFFCICLLLMQNMMEVECMINTQKTSSWTFPYSIWVVFFHTVAHSAMFSQLESYFAYHLLQMVDKVCSCDYKSFFEFTDRPSQKRSQLSFSLKVPWTVYGYVCGVSIAVVQFAKMNFSLQLDSNAAYRPFVL